MSDVDLHVDELDIVADAFEEAATLLGLDMAIIDDPDINVLRGIVIFLAEQLRRLVLSIDSEDVMCIAHDAQLLFEIVRPR